MQSHPPAIHEPLRRWSSCVNASSNSANPCGPPESSGGQRRSPATQICRNDSSPSNTRSRTNSCRPQSPKSYSYRIWLQEDPATLRVSFGSRSPPSPRIPAAGQNSLCPKDELMQVPFLHPITVCKCDGECVISRGTKTRRQTGGSVPRRGHFDDVDFYHRSGIRRESPDSITTNKL